MFIKGDIGVDDRGDLIGFQAPKRRCSSSLASVNNANTCSGVTANTTLSKAAFAVLHRDD